jgi:putative endonuclease
MAATRPEKGKRGEAFATEFLRKQGLEVVAQNVRCPLGEIDLIARDGPTLVFVEVKSRSSTAFGLPQEAVTKAKQRRLTRLALWYLKIHRLQHHPARFDVIAITLQETDPQINWIVNAFEATS